LRAALFEVANLASGAAAELIDDWVRDGELIAFHDARIEEQTVRMFLQDA
jgi:hypothetical protein